MGNKKKERKERLIERGIMNNYERKERKKERKEKKRGA